MFNFFLVADDGAFVFCVLTLPMLAGTQAIIGRSGVAASTAASGGSYLIPLILSESITSRSLCMANCYSGVVCNPRSPALHFLGGAA
jgi:hypothetical protein